jgi:hypothetical protein
MQDKKNTIKSSNKGKLSQLLDIFKPSALGLIIYLTIFIITLIFSQPSQYKTDIGSLNGQELNGTSLYKYLNYFNRIIDSQIVSQIAVYIFWVIVGIIVFVIASRLIKGFNELSDDYSLRGYIWPKGQDKNDPIKEFFEKLLFRTVVLILIVFYVFKSTPYLASIWRKTDLTIQFNFHILTLGLTILIVEILYLHILVVLTRLFLLRRRIVNF